MYGDGLHFFSILNNSFDSPRSFYLRITHNNILLYSIVYTSGRSTLYIWGRDTPAL